jgi:hypothetical protein
MTQPRMTRKDWIIATLWPCGIAAVLWFQYAIAKAHDEEAQENYDAICDAIAEAHGWNPKHLSLDQECTVETEADYALDNGARK